MIEEDLKAMSLGELHALLVIPMREFQFMNPRVSDQDYTAKRKEIILINSVITAKKSDAGKL